MAQYRTKGCGWAWTLAVVAVVLLAVHVREGQAARVQLKPPVRPELVADRQLQALQDFFKSTDGFNWVNNTGWASGNGDPCGRQAGNKPWYGITCSGGFVTQIRLVKNAVAGTLPSSIGDLPYVESIVLRGNLLIGGIPASLGDIQTLSTLDLSYNHFSGALPRLGSNSTSLTRLYLASNQIIGGIPDSFQSLTGLSELDLSNNRMTGQVPEWLASLSLTSLWIPYNNFSGKMPLRLCQSLILCSAAFNMHLMCASMSCTCGAMQSCNCNNLCQHDADCGNGLCGTCKGASPFMNGYCQ